MAPGPALGRARRGPPRRGRCPGSARRRGRRAAASGSPARSSERIVSTSTPGLPAEQHTERVSENAAPVVQLGRRAGRRSRPGGVRGALSWRSARMASVTSRGRSGRASASRVSATGSRRNSRSAARSPVATSTIRGLRAGALNLPDLRRPDRDTAQAADLVQRALDRGRGDRLRDEGLPRAVGAPTAMRAMTPRQRATATSGISCASLSRPSTTCATTGSAGASRPRARRPATGRTSSCDGSGACPASPSRRR